MGFAKPYNRIVVNKTVPLIVLGGTPFYGRMDLRETFAANLRRLRNAKDLSQDDLAYEAEISRTYLSQLEKGAFYASLKIIGRLANKIARGSFTAVFFLQCLSVIGCHTVRLDEG